MQTLPKSLIKFCWHFYKKQALAFTVFFIAPCALILDVTVIPYGLKMLVDVIAHHQQDRQIIWHAARPGLTVIAVAWIFGVIFMRLQNWWQAYVIPRFQADVRLSVLNYVIQHSYHYFANRFSGNIANKIGDLAKSLETIRMIISWNMIGALATSTASLIILFTVSPTFAAILGTWIAVHLIVTLSRASYVNRVAKHNAEDRSSLSGTIVDVLSNIIPVKLFASGRYEMQYVKRYQQTEASSNKKLILTMNSYRLLMDIPVTLMLIVMLYFLIHYWQLKLISAGDFVFIFNIAFAIMMQMWYLGHALAELFREVGISQQALTLITPAHDIQDIEDAKPLTVTAGEISFNNVTFNYVDGVKVFKNKDIMIFSGEKVGLVGFSGSGKSTFVNLILRFYDLDAGSIKIDGQDISQVTQQSLRANISMIPQDTTLFHRSIKDNIHYGNIDATDEQVIQASKDAYCHEFIMQLPQQYDTLVGERGIKLSGGQRQRIAIARAILKNAPILILDEATSSLDSATETLIQASLTTLIQGRTTIVIAHRLSTLAKMDRILVLDKGKIIEDGTHQTLLAANGHYAKLWLMQAGGFLPDMP